MANKVEVEVALSAKKAQKAVDALGKSLEKFTKKFGGQFDTAEKEYKKFGDTVEKSNKKVQQGLKKSDIALGSFIGNVTGGLALRAFDILKSAPLEAFEAFKKFEKGVINVAKTADLTDKQMEDLGKSIKKLSQEIPASTDELLEIATAAGQLGVRGTKNISNFAGTIAKLGRVTNISGEDASLALTRILNVTDTGIDQIDEFSSVIVALGNNFAATESEIVTVTNEVARATAQFGVSAEESAALATALRSVGVRAEEAGGVLSKTFVAIQDSITKGGKRMQELSRLTGIAANNLRGAFAEDALGVFQKLLDGISKAGPDASRQLEKIGLSGIRVSKVLPTLARNSDEFQRALNLANVEMKNATALNEEFAKSLKSSDSQVQLFRNELDLLAQDVGETLAPLFNSVAKSARAFIQELRNDAPKKTFAELSDEAQRLNKEISELSGTASFDLSEQLKLEEAKAELISINSELEKMKTKSLADLRRGEDSNVLPAFDPSAGGKPSGGGTGGLEPEDQRKIDSRKLANIQLQQLDAEADVASDERRLRLKEQQEGLTEADFEELNRLEQEKIMIKADAEMQKTALIKDSRLRQIEQDKIYAKEEIALEKQKNKALIAEEKRKAQQKKMVQQAQLGTARNFLGAGIALAKEGSSAQKALMIADATISTWAAATKALASPPGPPWSVALSSSIVALGLANVAKIAGVGFQNGGVVGGFVGSSVGPDNTTANVRTGEMILNSSQQKNMFDQINSGDFRGENSSVERLSASIESITSQPIIVQIDNKEVARAVRDAERDGFRVSA